VLAHRLETEGDLALDVVVDCAGHADATRLGEGFQACGDVDAIAINVVTLDDDVADVDADAHRDALLLRHIRLPIGDALFDRDGALDGIDHAGELDQRAVGHDLDEPTLVLGDLRLEEILTQRLEARVRALLVGRHQPAVADDVRGQYCRQPALHRRVLRPGAVDRR
jgi:hypothetical protein